MAASVEIAGRDVGLPAGRRRRLVTACVREYREGMRGFAAESHLDVWYDRLNASELVDRFGGRLGRKGRILFSQPFAKGRSKTSLRAVTKLTERVDGQLRFRSVPPLLGSLARRSSMRTTLRVEDEYVRELMDEYAEGLDEDRRYLFGTYRFVDMARKVVGVGSVGTRATVFLLVGRDGKDPLVLQAKEAQASVLEPHLGASVFDNHGERVVHGQRISHAASDIFLSWTRSMGLDGKEHDFYVRQLWDWKASIDLSTMSESGSARVHPGVRLVLGPRPCPFGRPAGHRRLPRRRPELRRGDRPLLGRLRRPERARPSTPGRGRRRRRGPRTDGGLTNLPARRVAVLAHPIITPPASTAID